MDGIDPAPADRLRCRLSDEGPMSVADYMAWCLTEGDTAYYRRGNPIGASGDFVTAPEVSQIFGELIAIWAVHVWQTMGMPSPFTLAELGPGRGTLMQDMLRAARAFPEFQAAAQVHLIETSSTLQRAQSETLSGFCAPQWHQNLVTLPDGPLIVIANEFFDALPVEQHIFQQGSWCRRMVALDACGNPALDAGRISVPPAELLPHRPPAEGDIIEHRPALPALLGEIAKRTQNAQGAVLIADYGYEYRDYGDTLQAMHSHGYVSPLDAPGEADLSAHVNFAELAIAAEAAGLVSWGPMPQGEFLLSLGMEQRLRRLLSAASEEQRSELFLGARRLVDPFQMGNLFKVLALTSPGLPAPPPFTDKVQTRLPDPHSAPYAGQDLSGNA